MFVRFFERVSDLFDRQQKKKERKKKSPLRFHSSEDRLLISMQGLLYYYHSNGLSSQTNNQTSRLHSWQWRETTNCNSLPVHLHQWMTPPLLPPIWWLICYWYATYILPSPYIDYYYIYHFHNPDTPFSSYFCFVILASLSPHSFFYHDCLSAHLS